MAVYTEITTEVFQQLFSKYQVGDFVSAKGIAEGIENSNYLIKTSEASFILTVYEERVNADDLPFFMALMRHLSDANIPCPEPVVDNAGEILQEIDGKKAALFTFLQGKSPKTILNEHCSELGMGLARMHVACEDFEMERANALSHEGWQALFDKIAPKLGESMPKIYDLVSQSLEDVTTHWPSDLPKGVIHADLFPDNVFFQGRSPALSGLLDFYFACNDYYIYDLAICINAWCFEADHEFNVTKARKLTRHYNKIRPLSEAEYEALPVLSQGAALRFLLTRLHDDLFRKEGGLVTPKPPKEYVEKLKFHRSVDSASAYGLEI